jgi:dTDP-4-dehydrorhamnose reductase
MKVLVIGANGQVGYELVRRGANQGLQMVGLDLPEIDITKSASVKKVMDQDGFAMLINAAAYTAVDTAESEPNFAFAVNSDGPVHLASACAEVGIPIVHISTDYVFDGRKKGAYLESDPVSPLGVYGKSKAAGEVEVRNRLQEHIILRTSWLYGVHGQNFVKTMLQLGREHTVLRVVADQYGCPTYAADLAEAILAIAAKHREGRQIAWGTYHYCGSGVTNWHEFAEKIFELARQHDSFTVRTVEPITTAEYPTPAERPANSVLDCSLITKRFSITPRPWPERLARMLELMLSPRESN